MRLEWDEYAVESGDVLRKDLVDLDNIHDIVAIIEASRHGTNSYIYWPIDGYWNHKSQSQSAADALDCMICETAKRIESLQAIKKELEAEYRRSLK